MRMQELWTRTRTCRFYRECARLRLVCMHLCMNLHEISNLCLQDSNWPPHKISWKSEIFYFLKPSIINMCILYDKAYLKYGKFSIFHGTAKNKEKVSRPNFCINFVPGLYIWRAIYQNQHIFLRKMSLLRKRFSSLREAKILLLWMWPIYVCVCVWRLPTLYYLDDLWLRLDLDLLLIARNAPGDSKWNPIEQ